jgi:CheY-like chemotaxis protein
VPYTLLLADDSVTIQRVIELTFADEDVEVVAVSDGDQAIAALDRKPPDIVLADVGMPGRDGYQVAQHIKNTPRLAHIPVVLLTGAFEPIDQARAAEVGCDGVLAKPFEPQQVIGRVKELLARPKPVRSSIDSQLSPPVFSAGAGAPPPALDLPLAAAAPPKPAEPSEGDTYFDRLDQAFATLTSGQPPAIGGSAPPPVNEAVDWFSSQSPSAAAAAVPDRWDVLPQPEINRAVAPSPAFDPAQPASAAQAAAPAPQAPPPPPLPPLADAFAALLAAEQSAPPPAASPSWPGRAAPGVVTNDVVEDITRRVLEQLSDRVVRETAAEIVSKVAERVVREEIERIKKTIK